jgi:hypothetical protein
MVDAKDVAHLLFVVLPLLLLLLLALLLLVSTELVCTREVGAYVGHGLARPQLPHPLFLRAVTHTTTNKNEKTPVSASSSLVQGGGKAHLFFLLFVAPPCGLPWWYRLG